MFASIKRIFGVHENSDEIGCEASDEILYNQLLHAIQIQDTEKAIKLISKIKNTDILKNVNNKGRTALISAADLALEKVCLALIPKMSYEATNVTEKPYDQDFLIGDSALIKAIWRNLDNACIELIPKMSDDNISHIDKHGRTLLMLAAKHGMATFTKVFIQAFIDRKLPAMIIRADNKEMTAVDYASTDKTFTEVRELLYEKQQNLLKKLASFINKAFLNNDGSDNFVKIVCATKFYKKVKVSKELLTYYLQKQNNNPESIIITMNNYIKFLPFAIAGVCKEINSIGF